MKELENLLDGCLNIGLKSLVLSSPRKKTGASKVKIRPVLVKDELVYQASVFAGTKVLHRNMSAEECREQIRIWLEEEFKQMQAEAGGFLYHVLVSKKKQITVKKKRCGDGQAKEAVDTEKLSHNRKKKYILEEGIAIDFLVDLGVMTDTGRIVNARYDKFRQINRYLEFVEDIIEYLPKDKEAVIVDFGCGKSYLTFALYYFLTYIKKMQVRVIGLDLKEDVIRHCSGLSDKYGYEKLFFYQGDIAHFDKEEAVDMVISLHACDTATDYALEKAVRWGAKVIMAVPCCQHELNGQIDNEVLSPVFQYGIIKERMAALITDGMRASILEECGYNTQVLEFIDIEHTPKNLLIRAVKRQKKGKDKNRERIDECLEFFGAQPTLETLLLKNQKYE